MREKKRVDLILVEKGFFPSRSKAESYIREGKVIINNKKVTKPGEKFFIDNINISILEDMKYVSRGGYKLEKAIIKFGIKVEDKICLDIGASTGGFTDLLLQYKAKKVYAIDVGYGQLDYKLRYDSRVIVYEKTNIRYVDNSYFDEKIDLVVIDVSFISVAKFLHKIINFLKPDFDIVLLFKPQFESEKGSTVKGIVKDKRIHKETLKKFVKYLRDNNLSIVNFDFSPIKGSKGNIEFLIHIKNSKNNISFSTIEKIIDESFRKLNKD